MLRGVLESVFLTVFESTLYDIRLVPQPSLVILIKHSVDFLPENFIQTVGKHFSRTPFPKTMDQIGSIFDPIDCF